MTLGGRKVTHKKTLAKALFLSYKQNYGGGVCNMPVRTSSLSVNKKTGKKGQKMINKYGVEEWNELKIPEKPENNIYIEYNKINNELLKLQVNKKIIKEKIIEIAHELNILLEFIKDE